MFGLWNSDDIFYHLLNRAQLSTAGMDFVQVPLDGSQVGDAITTTKFQNQLHKDKGERGATED